MESCQQQQQLYAYPHSLNTHTQEREEFLLIEYSVSVFMVHLEQRSWGEGFSSISPVKRNDEMKIIEMVGLFGTIFGAKTTCCNWRQSKLLWVRVEFSPQ